MCTRVLWNDNGLAIANGRSMDWFEDMQSDIWVFPKGIARNGGVKNPLEWVSKYGSVSISAYNMMCVDGINEKGFVVNPLWLAETDYGQRKPEQPAIAFSIATQYLLDNYASVAEVVKMIESDGFQIVTGAMGSTQKQAAGHFSIADANGDSAIIEYIDGQVKIYHSKEYQVMTNSPSFDQQLENLKKYRYFGGDQNLPGSEQSPDRFVRALRYLDGLPKPTTKREMVAYLMSVMRNASTPFGVVDPERPNVSVTRWRTIADLTHRHYFFESTQSPNIIWIDLDKLDFSVNASVKALGLSMNHDLVGDVSDKFVVTQPYKFLEVG